MVTNFLRMLSFSLVMLFIPKNFTFLYGHADDETVSLSTLLCDQEQDFRNNRAVVTHNACEQLLGKTLKIYEVPTVALCFSGGGYRAMIETLGALAGADEIGLLDAVMYTGGLSGSTWALTPWVFSGLSIGDYLNHISSNLNSFLSLNLSQILAINALKNKKLNEGKGFGLVDLYGALLAKNLLNGLATTPQAVTFTDLVKNLNGTAHPLPICTAVAGGVGNHGLWYECTPFTVGCTQTGFVPTCALGRTFENGVSVKPASGQYPSQLSLGDFMSMWGSAFAVDKERLEHEFGKMDVADSVSVLAQLGLARYGLDGFGGDRLFHPGNITWALQKLWPDQNKNFAAATVPNFTHNMQRDGLWNWFTGNQQIPLSGEQDLALIDGGYDLIDGHAMNLAIVPLLRPERKVDVIIVIDSSANLIDALSLRAAEKRAKALGLKFPVIDYTEIGTRSISVFKSDDRGVPTVIYMPCIKNEAYSDFDPQTSEYTGTADFYYTPEQVTELSGLTKFTMQQSKNVIVDALQHAVSKKQSWLF